MHYLIDRSGYLRSRYRHFEAGDDQAAQQLSAAIAQLAKEPFVLVSLHSH